MQARGHSQLEAQCCQSGEAAHDKTITRGSLLYIRGLRHELNGAYEHTPSYGSPPWPTALSQSSHRQGNTVCPQAHDIAADAPKQPPRFYAQPGQLPTTIGSTVELEAEEARHAVRVLRLKPGDAVELCDGRGRMVAAEIVRADKGAAMVSAYGMYVNAA